MSDKLKKGIAVGILGLIVGGGGVLDANEQANPFLDDGQKYRLEIAHDIPQGEHVEIHKDKAQMDLIGWNGEYKISVIPQIPAAQLGAVDRPFVTEARRPLFSKRMEYRQGEVTAFIEPRTSNEFDIDFTLHSKPDTNVFTYKIEGAEEFDFFYQPELTAEDIAEGISRPENVVGSYAVYHKTKANHRIGSTNYATGKAFHIYRPKAIDNSGAEVWVELNYTEGILSVTVPQSFLDNADYPVRVDPTFGYTTAGGSTTSVSADQMFGTDFTSPSDIVSVAGIAIAGSKLTSGTTNVKGVISLTSTESIITNGVSDPANYTTTGGFRTLTFSSSPALSVSTSYFLAAVPDTTTFSFQHDSGTGSFLDTTNSYASPTDPTDRVAPGPDRKFSVYVIYLIANQYTGSASSDIGFCYQDGTASCFTGATTANARIGYRVGANFLNITTGFRFSNIVIPQGSTINSATFTYTAFDTDATDAPTVAVYAEDIDNSPTFTTSGANSADTVQFGGSRATTTAGVSWTLSNQTINTEYSSPDISSVIQEVINRSGWASGNALSILIGPSTQIDNFNAKSATSTAFLTITYTAAAAGAPSISHNPSLKVGGTLQINGGTLIIR